MNDSVELTINLMDGTKIVLWTYLLDYSIYELLDAVIEDNT